MSYQHERDEFISRAVKEGLTLDVARKLLRYASTLHRLAECQCNGDWPYNGDRDRPSISELAAQIRRQRWDERHAVCPKCETSGVSKSSMRTSSELTVKAGDETGERFNSQNTKFRWAVKVCPDCRTQELVNALLQPINATIDTCTSTFSRHS